MFERYSESARRALFFARYEVTRSGGQSIDSEHLLLGVFRSPGPALEQIIHAAGTSFEELRRSVEAQLVPKTAVAASVEIPFSPAVARALKAAARQADELHSREICPEHLLLAVMQEETSAVRSVLARYGLDLQSVRVQLSALPPPSKHDQSHVRSLEVFSIVDRISQAVAELARVAGDREATLAIVQALDLELGTLQEQLGTREDGEALGPEATE